jgi:uncharacterized protein YbjT (DUF2867 family)
MYSFCGQVLVTGAAGGLGGIAIAILSSLGYKTVASSGRAVRDDPVQFQQYMLRYQRMCKMKGRVPHEKHGFRGPVIST